MNKTRLKGLVFLFSMLLILVNACNESEKEDVYFEDGEISVLETEQEAEMYFNIVESIGIAAILEFGSNSGARTEQTVNPEFACAEVNWNLENRRIVIDFGDGCKGPDNRTRTGKVIVEYSMDELVVESEFVTVLQNFYVDDVKIEGSRKITIESLSSEAISYTAVIEGGKITWPDETFVTRESEGLHTIKYSDLSLTLEGEASGTTKAGVSYFTETKDALIFKSDCLEYRLPVSGSRTITVEKLPLITVNYGNGDCDNKFTVSIGERSKEIALD